MSPRDFALAAAAVLAAAACAGVKTPAQQGSGGRGGSSSTGAGGSTAACRNLQCRQVYCGETTSTTLTGTVYAPDGKLPLYNVLVYVPNVPVPAIPSGLTCDRCGAIPPGEPVVAALTDAHGVFTLKDVPVGANIPLVIQVGKWRRQIVVPNVSSCVANQLDDPEQTRLPRKRSEGDMPRIAITTGVCDNLICLLPKLGIDPSELGIAGEDKAVIFYGGAELDTDPSRADHYDAHLLRMTSARTLWRSFDEIKKYDMVIASCECTEGTEIKGAAAYQVVTQYLAAGGRLFGTDLQYVWYKLSPDPNLSGWAQIPGGSALGLNPIVLDTTFPKGKALADWLQVVNPTATYGEVMCDQIFDNFTSAMQPRGRTWGTSGSLAEPESNHPRVLTVNAPAGAAVEQQCGRAVHIDGHITAPLTWGTTGTTKYPEVCGANLQNGEQALAFFLFDVAACIQEDSKPVMPPPVVP